MTDPFPRGPDCEFSLHKAWAALDTTHNEGDVEGARAARIERAWALQRLITEAEARGDVPLAIS